MAWPVFPLPCPPDSMRPRTRPTNTRPPPNHTKPTNKPKHSPMAAAVVSSSRKMEEGLPAKGISRASTCTTVEDTSTEGDSLGGDSSIEEEGVEEDEGVVFETRTHLTFPARHAEFDGLDPLSM